MKYDNEFATVTTCMDLDVKIIVVVEEDWCDRIFVAVEEDWHVETFVTAEEDWYTEVFFTVEEDWHIGIFVTVEDQHCLRASNFERGGIVISQLHLVST